MVTWSSLITALESSPFFFFYRVSIASGAVVNRTFNSPSIVCKRIRGLTLENRSTTRSSSTEIRLARDRDDEVELRLARARPA